MIYVYFAVTALLAVFVFTGRRFRKDFFADLPKKGHPLRIFYGASLRLYLLWRRLFPEKADSKVSRMIKSLCIKENVQKETVLYYVKKIALGLCILTAASFLGLVSCAADSTGSIVTSLIRNEYGGGTASYELGVSYDGTEETVEIEIEERLYTDEEIYALFDEAAAALETEILGDNESLESVDSPLDLVSGYGEIDIWWEIEDTQALDYNGEITAEIEDGESITVNLYATFSLEDVTAVYNYAVTLVAASVSEQEKLAAAIMEAIDENNDIYESEVSLPEEVDGKSITFSESGESSGAMYLILGIIALAAVMLVYDRKLEERMKERQNQMMLDFTEIVSKLSLLYEAGLSIYKSWERIISDYDRRKDKEEHFAYQEMKLAMEKIKSGVSEGAAYEEFGLRCALHPYIKLGNILSQNLSKGSRGMKLLLNQEAESSFEERKRLARKKGEEASTKMLLPMMMLLVIVIVIVAVPALMSINL